MGQKHYPCDYAEYHQVKLFLKAGYQSIDLSPTPKVGLKNSPEVRASQMSEITGVVMTRL